MFLIQLEFNGQSDEGPLVPLSRFVVADMEKDIFAIILGLDEAEFFFGVVESDNADAATLDIEGSIWKRFRHGLLREVVSSRPDGNIR